MPNLDKSGLVIRLFVCATLTVATFVAAAPSQSIAPEQRSVSVSNFLGTWTAISNKQPYWIVRITSIEPQVVGDFSHAKIVEFDTRGRVKEVAGFQELRDFEVMGAPKFKEGQLIFRWTDRSDAGELEMTLTGSRTATLRFINESDKEDDNNLRHLKPFQLRKTR